MNLKKIITALLVSATLLSLCSCSGKESYNRVVKKAYSAINEGSYDQARKYFSDTLSINVGETEILNCENANTVDNYILELIAKGTNVVNMTEGEMTAEYAVMTMEKTDKTMEIANIPNETAQMTFYFTENKISKIVYANRDEYNANYTKFQGGGGKFYAKVKNDSTFEVTGVEKGGPAAKAGLKVGDIITAIDKKDCTQMNAAVKEQSIRCRGEVGTNVTLTVSRVVKKETKTLEITFTRVAL